MIRNWGKCPPDCQKGMPMRKRRKGEKNSLDLYHGLGNEGDKNQKNQNLLALLKPGVKAGYGEALEGKKDHHKMGKGTEKGAGNPLYR